MNRKHKKGDVLVLSPDVQKIRNEILGKCEDLSPLVNKIVEFEIYDSIHIKKQNEIHMCRVIGQKLPPRKGETPLPIDIREFLIPETALITAKDHLIHLTKTTELQGIYKHLIKNANKDFDYLLFSLEISQQAQGGARSGIENCVGKEIVELSMSIFPNARLGDIIPEEYYQRFNQPK